MTAQGGSHVPRWQIILFFAIEFGFALGIIDGLLLLLRWVWSW